MVADTGNIITIATDIVAEHNIAAVNTAFVEESSRITTMVGSIVVGMSTGMRDTEVVNNTKIMIVEEVVAAGMDCTSFAMELSGN